MRIVSPVARALLLTVPQRFAPLRPLAIVITRWAANQSVWSRDTRKIFSRFFLAHVEGTSSKVQLRDGFAMELVPKDVIQCRLLVHGRYLNRVWEPNTALLLRHFAEEGGNFLVAGGHVGYFPLLIATTKGRTQNNVATFEPNESLRARLIENLKVNRVSNVQVESLALFSGSGITLDFYCDENGVCSSLSAGQGNAPKVLVSTITIDDYCTSRGISSMRLIVLDIEGGEPEAVEGAQHLLDQEPGIAPDLIFELVPFRRPREVQDALLARLNRSGYKLYVINDPYDYELADDSSGTRVPLVELRTADISEVEQRAKQLGLADPNIYATKNPITRLAPVAFTQDMS